MSKFGSKLLDFISIGAIVLVVMAATPITKALDTNNYQSDTFYHYISGHIPTGVFDFRSSTTTHGCNIVSATGATVHGNVNYTIVFGSSQANNTDETLTIEFKANGSGSISNLLHWRARSFETTNPSTWQGDSGVTPLLNNVYPEILFSNPFQSTGASVVFTWVPPSDGTIELKCSVNQASETIYNSNKMEQLFVGFPITSYYTGSTFQCFTSCSTGEAALVAIPSIAIIDNTPSTPAPVIPSTTCEADRQNTTLTNQTIHYVNTTLQTPIYGAYFRIGTFGDISPMISSFVINNGSNGRFIEAYPPGRSSSLSPTNDTGSYIFALSDSNSNLLATCAFVISTTGIYPSMPVEDTPTLTTIQQFLRVNVNNLQERNVPLNDSSQTHNNIASAMQWNYGTPWGSGIVFNMLILLSVAIVVAFICRMFLGNTGGGEP